MAAAQLAAVLVVGAFGLAAEGHQPDWAATEFDGGFRGEPEYYTPGMREDNAEEFPTTDPPAPWDRFTTADPLSQTVPTEFPEQLDEPGFGDISGVRQDVLRARQATTTTLPPIPGLEEMPAELKAFAELATNNDAAAEEELTKASLAETRRSSLPPALAKAARLADTSDLTTAAPPTQPASNVEWSFTDLTTGEDAPSSFVELPTGVSRYEHLESGTIDSDLPSLAAYTGAGPSGDLAADAPEWEDGDFSLAEVMKEATKEAPAAAAAPPQESLVEESTQQKSLGAIGRFLAALGAPLGDAVLDPVVAGL